MSALRIVNRTRLLKAADAVAGSVLCLGLGFVEYLRRRAPVGPDPAPASVRRILLVRPGGMGDMIILLPVVRTLQEHFPHAVVDLVCEKRNLAVLELAGLAERALVYDANPVRFLMNLCRRRYDIAMDMEQFHHFSAIFGYLSGAPVRVGFKINPRRNLLYTHLINYALDEPRASNS